MRPPAQRAWFDSDELLVDNFCGGGGTSLAIEMALGRSPDIAINHNKTAIRMHELNHPATKHYQEDIWKVDPNEACGGRKVGLAWFSPDCRHHSRAKGSKPVDKKIRGLAWTATRWARAVRPRVLMLENVIELEKWGPLDRDNMPIKSKEGKTFQNFVAQLRNVGYSVDWRRLVSADYGAPTTRLRLYMVARCDGEPIIWPDATHSESDWLTAAGIIDWSLPALSLFDPNRPRQLVEPTLRRIAMGLEKYCLDAATPFIVRHGHYSTKTGAGIVPGAGAGVFRGQPLDIPLSTVCATNDKDLVIPLITESYGSPTRKGGGGVVLGRRLDQPLSTVTARPHHALTMATTGGDRRREVLEFMARYGSGKRQLSMLNDLPPIRDILFRMLSPRELFRAQGFPDSYVIDGFTDSEQTRLAGNSVTPPAARALIAANLLGERTMAA